YSLEHQFNTNFSYQLPFGSGQRFGGGATGWVNRVIGGWQWNSILTAQSGFPATPLTGFDNTGNGDGALVDVPNLNPNVQGRVTLGLVHRWVDPRHFSAPIAGTHENAPRSTVRGPGVFNVDASFLKRIPHREGVTLQFRAEAFNVLNHANFAYPNPVI